MKLNKGIALITVMLVVALAATIATHMLAKVQIAVKKSANVSFNQQAYWYAMGAEAFAKRVLKTSFEETPDKTTLAQIWAQEESTYPVDYGEITGEISDLQACLNLNALRVTENITREKTPARAAFEALIIALNIEGVDVFSAEYMADALSDWLDSDTSIVSAGGAEDNDYSAKEFPYLPANYYLASVNELRVIEHFTKDVITALKPYVCVLPNTDLHQININTVSDEQPELLQALLDISKSEAQQILSARDINGFDNIDAFFNLPEVNKLKITEAQKQQFVVDSQYFTLRTVATFNQSYFYLQSMMQVNEDNQIKVISRTIGRD
ncbi:type II secretion system minor pseudopilin GspK [Thalassotalea sp. 1_MG-2023]|uniref:type II secretion system minor pseudopilin GspK n=1 Tax=Thalassotalea sp. 1_MG-2023 TaxID=3062680 RepID=UPI0026E39C0A|nr:type II secretion system minor pseudopilin GspK [Thalassotalea sp. 1_MG-2023]MDO6425709.1 type II secretion system minor pseudopilin GspK [Thalassotalea sp. 1_MG-2023]